MEIPFFKQKFSLNAWKVWNTGICANTFIVKKKKEKNIQFLVPFIVLYCN